MIYYIAMIQAILNIIAFYMIVRFYRKQAMYKETLKILADNVLIRMEKNNGK